MKEYRLPTWWIWMQAAGMIIVFIMLAALFVTAIIQRVVVNAPLSYVLMALFLLVPIFGLHFLWFQCPVRIIIAEDNTITFYAIGRSVSMPVTDIYRIRSGAGVWLYHARGRYAFTATWINTPLRDFMQEVSQRNPNITLE
jgi:hypothetical protein